MKNKKFIGIPETDLDVVVTSVAIHEALTGEKPTAKEIKKLLEKQGIEITDDVKKEINKAFPHIKL